MLRSLRALPPFALLLAHPLAAQTPPATPPKWDVTQPIGPHKTISFTTTEGTWMNVDVSPDGRTIVFDLMGDVYTMPIGGSGAANATRITSGPAFDMQPRFSPDGRSIAYISDRAGGHNIWLMNPDGGNARQVSKEQQRLVNSPTWSPDGQYIYVRKHFVQNRSLGAGEIWMYHVSGGDGLQVTTRNGWQKDAGEPAISPDGKYLYYSKDLTPGQLFEYDKDPYAGIYGIIRRDLTTGREVTVAGGPGGAITPRLSPDGKLLSFIRRVDLESILFLRDLASGREWPIFDHLDRDSQEAWSIHGVYPQYGWTADGRSIVVWGEGKIWKVDVAAKSGVQVPFTAVIEQIVHDGVRFPQQVAPAEFPVRMLRDVQTSPDGKLVAYSALGRIYTKRLPDGAPVALNDAGARAEGRLAFDPAFSPDGQWLVYTTWTDTAGGRVRVVRTDGTQGRDVVRMRGHYAEAAFSPDGKQIVYRAVGGDYIRGSTYGVETGVYIVPMDGTREPERVTESGNAPMFDHTGTRIYLAGVRNEKTVLYSVELDGSDEVVHFQSDNATQIVPSPDGKWVAFAERYHAYIAAFPRSGRTVDLGPRTAGFPVQRISRDAGMYLHWSGDSRKVHWTLGPELFTRDLARTFTYVGQGLEKPDEPESRGVAIGFTAKADVPTGNIALVGARVITMNPAQPVIENAIVIVRGNRIASIGNAAVTQVPADTRRIDVSGKTIIPGIIDVHAHVGGEGDGLLAQQSWPLLANLAFGVTTSHDPSNDTETVFTNAEMIRAGLKLGPRLFSTGTILYGAEGNVKAVVESYEDAVSHLRRMKAVGAFSVKSYNHQRRDARQMILKAAREQEMMVVPEGGSLVYFNESMVMDGHTGVEHSLPVPVLYKDIVQLFAQSTTGYTPTLIVGYGGLSGENYFYQNYEVWKHEQLMRFTPPEVVANRRRRRMAAADDFNHIRIARGAKQILDAGGLVNLGAHGQLQGLGAHWELWMFEQGGMTPMEALRVATINGAKYIGMDRDLGSLEAGKLADLVVLDRNPLENIRNTDSVRMVMLNGRLYDAATLTEVGASSPRAPLFWQR